MNDLKLQCSCGMVKGIARNISPKKGNHIMCHCDDCQAFASYLGRTDILDKNKGTDIFQTSYANIEITEGVEQLRSIKLRPKGLVRWYADCCKTPVGNTISGSMPFIGLIHNFISENDLESKIGPIKAHTFIKQDSPVFHLNTPMYKVLPMMTKLLYWKIRDRKKLNPFFDVSGTPVSEPKVLTS